MVNSKKTERELNLLAKSLEKEIRISYLDGQIHVMKNILVKRGIMQKEGFCEKGKC